MAAPVANGAVIPAAISGNGNGNTGHTNGSNNYAAHGAVRNNGNGQVGNGHGSGMTSRPGGIVGNGRAIRDRGGVAQP